MAFKGKIDRYPDVQEVVVTAKRARPKSRPKPMATKAIEGYDKLSRDYPKTKFALDMLPVTGQVTSALDSISDMHKGEYGKAAVDAAGLIPGVKWAKELNKIGDVKDYIENEKFEKNARGGLIKSRDGIAKRGKTKGRMR